MVKQHSSKPNRLLQIKKFVFQNIILLIIPLCVVILWFHNGHLLAGGEEILLSDNNAQRLVRLTSSMWFDISTGVSTPAFLAQIPFILLFLFSSLVHFPSFLFQAILIYVLMITGVFSMYFLVIFSLKDNKNKQLISTCSAIFYLLNPYTIMQIWERGLTPQYFLFAATPLFLLLFVIGLKARNYIMACSIALTSVLFSTTFTTMTNIIVIWSVIGIYVLYKVISNSRDILYTIRFFSVALIFWMLISAWWLLPLVMSLGNTNQTSIIDPKANMNSLIGVSQYFPLSTLIRLGQDFYFFNSGIYGEIYKNGILQGISWIMPLMLFFAFFNLKRIKGMKFLLTLFLIGLFVSLGSNPPFGNIFIWFFDHFTFLQAFRNPYEKYGIVLLLGYSPLFAVGLFHFSKLVERFISFRFSHWVTVCIVLFLASGIYTWPMINHIAKKGVVIPSYYSEAKNWLAANNIGDSRIIMTPLTGEGIRQNWNGTIYNGVDPATYLLDYPVISNDLSTPYTTDFIYNIKKNMNYKNVSVYFSMFSTKYLFVRNDVLDVQNETDKYFFKKIYEPSIDKHGESMCLNKVSEFSTSNPARIICSFDKEGKNISKTKFLTLTIKTNQPAYLVVNLYDNRGVKISWDGIQEKQYGTIGDTWENLTLPIFSATQFYDYFNLSHISNFEILAYPKTEEKISQIYLENITPDQGNKVDIDSYHYMKHFDKLDLYISKNKHPSPIFGLLFSIKPVKNFQDFFYNDLTKESLSETGFVINSQNPKKNLTVFSNNSNETLLDKQKMSVAKYWLKTSSRNDVYILLSETFNPQWKIIRVSSKKDLENNFINNINLINKETISEENHYVVNGYANLWRVRDGNEYGIVFLPQIYADIGSSISKIFFLTFIVFLSFPLLKKIIIKMEKVSE